MQINNNESKEKNILSKKQEHNIIFEVYQIQVDSDDIKNAIK